MEDTPIWTAGMQEIERALEPGELQLSALNDLRQQMARQYREMIERINRQEDL